MLGKVGNCVQSFRNPAGWPENLVRGTDTVARIHSVISHG